MPCLLSLAILCSLYWQNSLSHGEAELQPWWTYISEPKLSLRHRSRMEHECSDHMGHNNLDALIGATLMQPMELIYNATTPSCKIGG